MNRPKTAFTAILAAGVLVMSACTSSGDSLTTTTTASAATSAVSPEVSASGTSATGRPSAATGSSSAGEPAYVADATVAVEKAMKANVIPGAVVLVSSPDQGDWTGTFGTRTWGADEPMLAIDHFRIGSNTKTLTSTVILQLAQEGKLALDDPIAK